jgi:hypothetical protein
MRRAFDEAEKDRAGTNDQWDMGSAAVCQRFTDASDQTRQFTPKQEPHDSDPTDQAKVSRRGQALIAMLRQAAKLSNDNRDRAMAYKLSVELRAAEDRVKPRPSGQRPSKRTAVGPRPSRAMILESGDLIASSASRPSRAHSARNTRSARAPKYLARRRRSSCDKPISSCLITLESPHVWHALPSPCLLPARASPGGRPTRL